MTATDVGADMTRTQYYVASSLDGFIADAANDLTWLLRQPVDPTDGPLGYESFIAHVGAIALGTTTMKWLLDHDDGPWPYEQPCWLFTHQVSPELPRDADIRVVSGDVARPHADMVSEAAGRNVWVVGGGDLAGQFADAGLLDDVLVSVAPVTLGMGAPLLPRALDLELVSIGKNQAFACLTYRVLR